MDFRQNGANGYKSPSINYKGLFWENPKFLRPIGREDFPGENHFWVGKKTI